MTDKTAEKVISFYGEEEEIIYPEESEKKEKRQYLQLILYALGAFFFSSLTSLGEMSPFTVSFLCAVPYDFSFAVFMAGSVGYFLSQGVTTAIKYTVCLALVCIFKLIIHKRFSHREGGYAITVVCFFCFLAVNLSTFIFNTFSLHIFFSLVFECVLSVCALVFFIKSYKIPFGRVGISSLGVKESLCLFLSLAVFLMCMSDFTVEGISLGRVLSIMVLLFVSLYKGVIGSSVFGAVFALSLSIGQDERFLFPAIVLSAVLSGVFSLYGQIVSSLSFLFCYLISLFFFGGSEGMLIYIVEAVLSVGAFMLVPSKWITSLQDSIEKTGAVKNEGVNTALCNSLNESAENIYEIARIIGNISEKLDSVINPEVDKLFSFLQQRVCTDCKNKSKCWNKNFDTTAEDIMVLSGITDGENDSVSLRGYCSRFSDLLHTIETAQTDYTNNMAMKMKLREMRMVLTDQFSSVGDFLSESAEKIANSRIPDPSRSASMRSALIDSGVYVDALTYFTDSDGRVSIEITVIDRAFETDCKKAKTVIEVITKRFFEKPIITANEIKTTILFEERASFKVQFGYHQKPMIKGTLCGDSVRIVKGKDGTKNAFISDGMGTGSRAAIDSTLTCSILAKLLSSGFSFDSALKIVNSAMIIKSTDETLATIDGVSINVYSGRAVFYKAGATLSFVRRDGAVETVDKQSLPIGIIRNITFAKMRADLIPGDIILMVSDGVTAGDCGWIIDELLAWSTNNMGDLAKHIVSLASLRSDETTRDDITALAIKVTRAV